MEPVIAWTLRVVLALLFGISAWEKLQDFSKFKGVMRDYQLIPPAWISIAARSLIVCEGVVAIALVATPWAGLGVIGLLVVYGAAIAINLARGRTEIDCGCGGTDGQPLSSLLLVRNALLAAAALGVLLPLRSRALGAEDIFAIGAAVTTISILWTASGQLLKNTRTVRSMEGTR
jgi:uncharacterized membrane protein YphA (DoxX/SURF4 family)